MTKITLILDAWEPIIGGGQKLFLKLIKGLVKDHHCQITLITRSLKDKNNKVFNQNQSLLNDQFKVIRLGPVTHFNNPVARLLFIFTSFFEALKNKPDLYLASSFLPGFTLQLLKLVKKIPVVLVAIGFGAKSKFYQKLEKLITEKFKYDLLITDDHVFFESIKFKRKTVFIPNGVKLPKKLPHEKHPVFTFLFIGRDEPRKGIKILRQAFTRFQKLYPKSQLKLFGPNHNPVSNQKINQELFKSHCLVLPSLKEGHPLILFEAFAHKLPVIATKVGSIPKFVNQNTGYLIKPNSVTQLVKAMKQAYKNPNLAVLGQNGHRLVKNQFTWQKTINNYHQALKNLSDNFC